MSDKRHLHPLAARKQSLIAESEQHRDQLASNLRTLSAEARTFASKARAWAGWASSAVVVLAGLSALWRGRRLTVPPRPGRRTWLQKAIHWARWGWGFWVAFRPRVDKTISRY